MKTFGKNSRNPMFKNRNQAKSWFMRHVRPKIRANRSNIPELAELWPDTTFGQWLKKGY